MTSDGDAIFASAVMTLCRSSTPRDGGVVFKALADWMAEQFGSGRQYVCVADTQTTGWFLVVQHLPGKVHPFYCFFVGGQEHSWELKTDYFKELTDTRKRRVKDSTFIGWLEETIRASWTAD